MKKRTGEHTSPVYDRRLALLTAAFSGGAALGSILMGKDQATAALLANGLLDPLRSAPTYRMMIFDAVLIMIVFVAAFVRWGAALCLMAMTIKGLLLSMTVTSFIRTLGAQGWGVAFAMTFLAGLFTVASLLLLSLQAVQPSGRRVERRHNKPDGVFFLTSALCAGIMLLGELIILYLARPLAKTALSFFSMQ